MKTKERIKAARQRIKELQELIRDWDLAELDKQISAGDMGRTDYDPDNIDNVKYFSQEESSTFSESRSVPKLTGVSKVFQIISAIPGTVSSER